MPLMRSEDAVQTGRLGNVPLDGDELPGLPLVLAILLGSAALTAVAGLLVFR